MRGSYWLLRIKSVEVRSGCARRSSSKADVNGIVPRRGLLDNWRSERRGGLQEEAAGDEWPISLRGSWLYLSNLDWGFGYEYKEASVIHPQYGSRLFRLEAATG